jgi:N utilization substance protein A
LQRLREAERELLFQEFAQHEGDIMSGIVETSDPGRAITLDLGRAQAILPHEEQVSSERYRKGQRVKVFILSVRSAPKGPEILVSRSHRNVLRRLFEIEVPEVHNGVVEIKAIAREAGFRSKVAVSATQSGIDPVGSCIGIRGNRIQSIVNELQGEKIDIVSWDSDPRAFIANSLSPSEPVQVELLETDQTAVVVVPDRQLSLAIGKEGQNTRLAARLTGWRLDIKGMTEWEAIREARLHAAAEAAAKAAEEAAALAIAQAEAIAVAAGDVEVEKAVEPAVVAEAEAIVEEVSLALEIPETVDTTEQEAVIEASEGDVNDDGVLEALIREEELLKQIEDESAAEDEVQVGISVDDLDSFTLDDIPILDEEDEEEIEEEPIDFAELPVLTPDAGKIRFAEDIVEEVRGGGRRGGGRARRGGGGGSRRR